MTEKQKSSPLAAPKAGENNEKQQPSCADIAREWIDVIKWNPSMARVFEQAEAQQNEIAAHSIHMIHRNCVELQSLTKVATEYSIAVLAQAAGLKEPLPMPLES